MRCNNCGWQNPDGVVCCERCGSALSSQNNLDADKSIQQNDYNQEASSPLRSTLREAVAFGGNLSLRVIAEVQKIKMMFAVIVVTVCHL